MSFFTDSIQTSGSYGLHSATWKSVRRALKQLGAQPARTTNKEFTIRYSMPSGHFVHVGRASADNVMDTGLAMLMEQVQLAVEPLLFLAVLELNGASWHQKPAVVTQLAKYLRSLNALPLASRTQYQRVLKDFSEHCRQSGKKEEEPVEQVPEEAKEQTPAVQPKVYPYGVREVMELADVAEYRDAACLTWLYQELRGGPLTEELVRRELMADPGSEGRAKYALSSEGVLHLASMVIQRERRLGHLPPAPNEEPEEPEQEPEPSPAPKPAPEPRKEPLSPGEAAVALAKDAGVPLPWCADEPLRVDVARLLVLLAERL